MATAVAKAGPGASHPYPQELPLQAPQLALVLLTGLARGPLHKQGPGNPALNLTRRGGPSPGTLPHPYFLGATSQAMSCSLGLAHLLTPAYFHPTTPQFRHPDVSPLSPKAAHGRRSSKRVGTELRTSELHCTPT